MSQDEGDNGGGAVVVEADNEAIGDLADQPEPVTGFHRPRQERVRPIR
jgi:hypothetical protein